MIGIKNVFQCVTFGREGKLLIHYFTLYTNYNGGFSLNRTVHVKLLHHAFFKIVLLQNFEFFSIQGLVLLAAGETGSSDG